MSKKTKMELFENEDDNSQVKLKINQGFAEKFTHNKKREELDQAKSKYGKAQLDRMVNDDDGDESSDIEDEDEHGELINEHLADKFLTTLAKIKLKNPEIYDAKKEFFEENDFDLSGDDDKNEDDLEKKKKKKKTIKDIIREDALRKLEKNSDDNQEDDDDEEEGALGRKNRKTLNGETPYQEQQRIKNEFKKAVKQFGEEDSDDMFEVKKKTEKEVEDESKEFKRHLKKQPQDQREILERFWGDEEKLDDTDKFLKKYILTKAWIDRDDLDYDEQLEEQDEQVEEQNDRFESKYNFRFEETGANKVKTYARKIEESVRQKEATRSEKKKEKKKKQQEEKVRMQEEIKRLKNIKKDEILDRISKIQKISAKSSINEKKIQQILDEDFDADKFNQNMEQEFGEQYYHEADINEGELGKNESKEQSEESSQKGESDWEEEEGEEDDDDKDKVIDVEPNLPFGGKQNITEKDLEHIQGGDDSNRIFWYCDCCKRGIQVGETRFDSQELPDYTLCKQCYESDIYQGPVKKYVVPKGCHPPPDDVILDLLEGIKICQKCNSKLSEYCNYYCLKVDEDCLICEICHEKLDKKKQKNYTLVESENKIELEQVLENPKEFNDEVIDKMVEDYYNLDFEDVIAGGIKTRFKYIDVKPDNYGLDDENLVFGDDKTLNSLVSLKKLAPYREDEGHIKSKHLKNKLKLKQIEKSTKLNQQLIEREQNKVHLLDKHIKKEKNVFKSKKLRTLEKQMEHVKKTQKQQISLDRFSRNQKKQQQQKQQIVLEEENQDNANNKHNLKLSSDRLKSYGLL